MPGLVFRNRPRGFHRGLGRQVTQCDVLLAVIGPRWAELLAERLGDLGDFVVVEIKAGSDDKTLRLWDVATAKEFQTFTGHTGVVRSVAISPDSRTALSGSRDKTLKLWDLTPYLPASASR